jgi:hypothetical protein
MPQNLIPWSDQCQRAALVARLFNRREIVNQRTKSQTSGKCWRWRGATNAEGYGVIKVGGKAIYTHRLSAHLWLGLPLDSPLLVRHRCIACPECFNPLHLCVGTCLENNRDTVIDGRHSPGGKLSNSAVNDLIRRVRRGMTTIAKWAHLKKISYRAAYAAYTGQTHTAVATAAHARWDARGTIDPVERSADLPELIR